jgi:putative ABC transport system permease protein
MGTVVGVVKDFHNKPLHQPIEPVAFKLAPRHNWANSVAIKVNSGSIKGTISAIEDTWSKVTKGIPFNYNFMDKAYDKMYKSEIQLSTLFRCFSILAILISCLGLLGMVSITTKQSIKEIGIRKLLGATVIDIVKLLSWRFTKWVVLANFIAWPLAYLIMKNWLQDFAYRVHINGWIFISVGILALGIAILTVSYQSIRAASANPVDAFKYE